LRLFIGIDIPAHIKESIAITAAAIERRFPGRYASDDGYHITLAYIGECDDDMRNRVVSCMKSCAAEYPPVSIDICGAGLFASPPKAILHLHADSHGLLQPVCNYLRSLLVKNSLPFDPKPLVPHITLARKIASDEGIDSIICPEEAFTAEGLTLFHSCRVDDRLRYIPIHFEPFSQKGDSSNDT